MLSDDTYLPAMTATTATAAMILIALKKLWLPLLLDSVETIDCSQITMVLPAAIWLLSMI
jgi:hypothetical protein